MSGKLQIGINDLQSRRPELAAEWHPVKNGALLPQMVCEFSSRRVWWQKKVCRFGREFVLEWEATVSNRANGSGCPYITIPPRKLLKGFNDLRSTNPRLAERWHPEKNDSLTPDDVFENTERQVWWQHTAMRWGKEFIHEWQASPKSMKNNIRTGGCPICHGIRVLAGYNDLRTVYPELCREWNYARNDAIGLVPESVTPGSNKKVWWRCDLCGHEWQAMILGRTEKRTGCPACARRVQTSFDEQAIYFYLRQRFSCVNRDRSVLDRKELDIYLPDFRFAVEYCGLFSHRSDKHRRADQEKQAECREKGIYLLSIYETEHVEAFCPEKQMICCIPRNDHSHLYYIVDCLNAELKRLGISSVPIMADLHADERAIREQYQLTQISKNLTVSHPQLVGEWDTERNGQLLPGGFSAGSTAIVYWKHTAVNRRGEPCLHSWRASIGSRTRGQGCPICAGKTVQIGFNDLQSLAPPFLPEWDAERNTLSPEQITAYSKRKVWWWHSHGGVIHNWTASPGERMRGNGCAICAGKSIVPGINDLAATEPELLAEWDYEKNERSPEEISRGYDKKVWWMHRVPGRTGMFVHSWQASPNSRTNMHSGCPYCANKRVLPGYNDLQSSFPEIAELWDHDRNAPLKPSEVTPASAKKVYWTDREHQVSINDRTRGLKKNDRSISPVCSCSG